MAELASYIGVTPRTVRTNTAVGRGLRVVKGADGLVSLAGDTVRGSFVTLEAIEASSQGAAASMAGGGKVPIVASEAVNAGDLAYAAANGKASKTSTNVAFLGRWALGTTGADILGEVELLDVQ